MAQDIVNENQKISYTNLDFSAIYTETLDLIKQLTYRWDPSISDESDPGVVLVKLSALLADKLNYNIDKNVLETYPLSVTQDGNARQLYDQLGYYMDWYQSGAAPITLNWTGSTGSEVITYKIPKFTPIVDSEQTSGKRYTLIGVEGADEDIVSDILLTTDGKTVIALALEGFPVQYQYEGEKVITSQMVDPLSHRLYFTTKYISQNGVFIKNTEQENYADWKRVNNLYENSYNELRYIFGYDSSSDTCYLEFPDNYAELFGSGIEITYLIIDPTSGNVVANELVQFISAITVSATLSDGTTSTVTLSTDNVSLTNYLASSGHMDVEGLNEAYQNYKKTVGTFKTLITLRDYLNYIRNEDLNICSNAFVCDRTNDVQTVYKIINKGKSLDNILVKVEKITDKFVAESTFNYTFSPSTDTTGDSSKTYYIIEDDVLKEVTASATENPKELGYYEATSISTSNAVEPYTLKFYLLKKGISLESKTAYNETFTIMNPYPDFDSLFADTSHLEHNYGDILPLGEHTFIKSTDTEFYDNKSYWLYDSDTDTYDLITDTDSADSEFAGGDPSTFSNVYNIDVEALMPHIVFYKAFYPVMLNISTYNVLDSDTQSIVMKNVINSLYDATSSAEIEFGDEVSLEYISNIVKASDTRIKAVTLDTINYYLYATYYDKESGSYVEVRIDDDMGQFLPESYRNLADIINSQVKRDIMAKSVLAGTSQLIIPDTDFIYHLPQQFIAYYDDIGYITTEAKIDIADAATSYAVDNTETIIKKTYTIQDNENLYLYRPHLIDTGEFLNGIHYEYLLKHNVPAKTSYKLQTGEYFILYNPQRSETSNEITSYVAYGCGSGCIICPSFKLTAQTSRTSLSNFAKTQVLAWFEEHPLVNYQEFPTSNTAYMTEIRNSSAILSNEITGSNSIKIQEADTVEFTRSDKYKFYWILKQPTYSSNENLKSYTLFNSYDSSAQGEYSNEINSYTLKNGEALLYMNAEGTAWNTLGAGTTLFRNCGVETSDHTPVFNSIFYTYVGKASSIVENSSFETLTNDSLVSMPRESGQYIVQSAIARDDLINASEYANDTTYAINDIVYVTEDSTNTYYIRIVAGTDSEWTASNWTQITSSLHSDAIIANTLSPFDLNFYEAYTDDEANIDYYAPSTDTEYDSSKTYYIVIFTRTTDTVADSSTAYYILTMYKKDSWYIKSTNDDGEDVYTVDSLADSDCFEEVSFIDYTNPTIINPVEQGYYKKMSYNNRDYIDTYSINSEKTAREYNRYVVAEDIFSGDFSNRGNEYYEHDSSVFNRFILNDTDYKSIDISNIDTYTDIDLSVDDFSPTSLNLLEPSDYITYYSDSEGTTEVEVNYLTNPYTENLYIKVDGIVYPCFDYINYPNYVHFTPAYSTVTTTTQVALFNEKAATYDTDVANKGYYYKPNSTGTVYRYLGGAGAVPYLRAATAIESSTSPLLALYNAFVAASADATYSATSTAVLEAASNAISSSVVFQKPYEAPADFSSATTYNYGDKVYNTSDNKYYKCIVSSVTGEFDSDDWVEISINWRTASFSVYSGTPSSITSQDGIYIKVLASAILEQQIKLGTIYPAFELGDTTADSYFYVNAIYASSFYSSTPTYYTIDNEVGNELNTDEALYSIFPNSSNEISEYATIRLYYLPKLYLFNDFVHYTTEKYYQPKDYYNRTCDLIDAWSVTAIDSDTVLKDPITAIQTMWASLQTNTSLTVMSNDIEAFTAGDKIIFSTDESNSESINWPEFSNDEIILDLDTYDVTYLHSGETEFETLKVIDVDEYKWRGYSSLLLNASSTNGQKLESNHTVKLYTNESDLTPIDTIVGDSSTNISLQLKNSIQNSSGAFISVSTLNSLNEEEKNSVYIYQPYSDGTYYKYDTASNTTSLYFNSVDDADTDGDGVIDTFLPQEITLPFGLPGGEYLLGVFTKDDINLQVVNNNILTIDGITYNLDAPVVNEDGNHALETGYVNYLHSYSYIADIDEEETDPKFTDAKYHYLYMYTGEGGYRKISAPSLIAIAESPADLGWYYLDDGEYILSTNTATGSSLIIEASAESDSNPAEEGWYELSSGNYIVTSDTEVDDSKTYYTEPDLYVKIADIESELIFTIDDNTTAAATYVIDDIFKFEPNSAIGDFTSVRQKVRDLDIDEEYNYTFIPESNDLIENPLSPKSFFRPNHVFHENIIAQLDFDNLDYRFTTIR